MTAQNRPGPTADEVRDAWQWDDVVDCIVSLTEREQQRTKREQNQRAQRAGIERGSRPASSLFDWVLLAVLVSIILGLIVVFGPRILADYRSIPPPPPTAAPVQTSNQGGGTGSRQGQTSSQGAGVDPQQPAIDQAAAPAAPEAQQSLQQQIQQGLQAGDTLRAQGTPTAAETGLGGGGGQECDQGWNNCTQVHIVPDAEQPQQQQLAAPVSEAGWGQGGGNTSDSPPAAQVQEVPPSHDDSHNAADFGGGGGGGQECDQGWNNCKQAP